jgi:hypothetical protein
MATFVAQIHIGWVLLKLRFSLLGVLEGLIEWGLMGPTINPLSI